MGSKYGATSLEAKLIEYDLVVDFVAEHRLNDDIDVDAFVSQVGGKVRARARGERGMTACVRGKEGEGWRLGPTTTDEEVKRGQIGIR